MRVIGLIGGMSWESSATYYRHINEAVRERLGGLHSARIVLYSVDFHDVEELQRAGAWHEAGELLADAARAVHAAGADFLVLCTNTMHKVAPAIEAATPLPLLHIADATGKEAEKLQVETIGLLGTRFTMEEEFYRKRLAHEHGLTVLLPGPEDRELVHRVIFNELCTGTVNEASRAEYRRIMGELVGQGAQAIVLGCTEISLLVTDDDASVPLLDTTGIHARRAVDWALAPE